MAEVIGALRAQLTTENWDAAAFLAQVVEQIQLLFGTGGIAIAVRHGSEVICIARLGAASPPLGARVDAHSGISGECLRTGKSLRCEDTETDPRVDRALCRQLGLRSIAVVPVRTRSGVAGLLEMFSAQPLVFQEWHLEVLQQFSDLVAACIANRNVATGDPVLPSEITFQQAKAAAASAVRRANPAKNFWSLAFSGQGLANRCFNGLTRLLCSNTAISVLLFLAVVIVFGRGRWHRTGVPGVAQAARATRRKVVTPSQVNTSAPGPPPSDETEPAGIKRVPSAQAAVETASASVEPASEQLADASSSAKDGPGTVDHQKPVNPPSSSGSTGVPDSSDVLETGNGFNLTSNAFGPLDPRIADRAFPDSYAASLRNVKKIFVEGATGSWGRTIQTEISKQVGDRLTIVPKKNDADAILVSTEVPVETGNKLMSRMMRVPPLSNDNEVLTLYDKDQSTVLWSSEAGGRSLGWRTLIRGRHKKLAEQLVRNLKSALEHAN